MTADRAVLVLIGVALCMPPAPATAQETLGDSPLFGDWYVMAFRNYLRASAGVAWSTPISPRVVLHFECIGGESSPEDVRVQFFDIVRTAEGPAFRRVSFPPQSPVVVSVEKSGSWIRVVEGYRGDGVPTETYTLLPNDDGSELLLPRDRIPDLLRYVHDVNYMIFSLGETRYWLRANGMAAALSHLPCLREEVIR